MNINELLNKYNEQETTDEDSAYFLLESTGCCICDCLSESLCALCSGFGSACVCC